MHRVFLIPLAAFAGVVLIIAIVCMAKLKDKENEVMRDLHIEEMDHRRRMAELQQQLDLAKRQ